MSNRSLINFNNNNTFLGYPVSDTPTDNTALFFVNGEFFFATISESGGIIGVLSLGGGASVFKNISGGILELRSFISPNSNIEIQQLTNNIDIHLSDFLTGLKKITFFNNISLEEATDDLNFNIDDGGASVLKNLYFRTKYGVLSAIAMSINNQARIDVYGEMFLNSIADGTPNANKFLSLDSNGKIIKSTVTDTTIAANIPGTNNGWYMGKVGDTLQFRSFVEGLNFNVGIQAGEYLLNVDTTLNNIVQINPNLPRSPATSTFQPDNLDIRIGSENIYLDNFEIASPNPFITIEPDGKLTTSFAVTDLTNTGGGAGIANGFLGSIGKLKSLISGQNINITTNTDEITINTTNNLENIANINTTTTNPSAIQIHNSYVNFPNLIDRSWNPATKKNIFLDLTDQGFGPKSLCTGYSVNTISNVGTNSLIAADTISSNGDLQLKGLVAGTGIILTPGPTNITISAPTANTNIFNSDGTSTSSQRIFSGFNPGNINNKLTINDCNLGLTNSLPYNRQFIGSIATTSFLGFADGGNYSKFVEAPYNHLSQRIDVPLISGYGQSCVFYQSTGLLTSSNLTWIFEIEIYQNVVGLSQAFVGRYKFSANSTLAPATYYIKPETCSALNGTAPQNVCGLEAYRTVDGLEPVWVLRLVNLGLGLTGPTTTYSCFVKDLGVGNKNISTVLGPSSVTPTANYFNDFQFLYVNTTGLPPNSVVNYNQFGKDLRITLFGTCTMNNNQNGILNILFNGVNVYIINFRSNAQGYATISASRTLRMVNLINTGALVLNNSFNLTYTVAAAGFNSANQPFTVDIQYV